MLHSPNESNCEWALEQCKAKQVYGLLRSAGHDGKLLPNPSKHAPLVMLFMVLQGQGGTPCAQGDVKIRQECRNEGDK